MCLSALSHFPIFFLSGISAPGLYTLAIVPNAFIIILLNTSHILGGVHGRSGHDKVYSLLHLPNILPGDIAAPCVLAIYDTITNLK